MSTAPRHSSARARRTIRIVLLGLLAFAMPRAALAQAVPPTCDPQLGTADLIDHDLSVSFCELCDRGTVQIEIENPFDPGDDLDFSNLIVREDLQASGLTYAGSPTSTVSFSGQNISVPAPFDPTVSGPNGSLLTWDFGPSGLVLPGRPGGAGNRARLVIEFEVERAPGLSDEGLMAAVRDIEAEVELEPSCAPGDSFSTTTGDDELPLREPEPVVIKAGRNLDASQGGYSDPVYGHEGDDVIWRVQIRNDGDAPLQDFVFDDAITTAGGTTYEFTHVCDDEADAVSAGSGGPIGNCDVLGRVTSVANVDVAARFGGGANPYIVAPAGGSGFYYFVGEIIESCADQTNTVSGVEWGCQSDTPVGGLSATSSGATAGDDGTLGVASVAGAFDIDVDLTGVSLSEAMGGTGTVTITLTNGSGGTVRGEAAGLRIRNLLPAEYVVDTTAPPAIAVSPAYGTYDGMIDTIAWTNPAGPTVPPENGPLSNTELQLLLTSSTTQTHPTLPDQEHLIRHGDVVTITIRTVLIDPTYYDYTADLDVRTEAPGGAAMNSDPTESFPIANQTEVWWQEFCTATLHNRVVDTNDTANPEDIDPDVRGSELIFILTDTGDRLPLIVDLENNGGHTARDYVAYVTFGEAMTVDAAPGACSLMSAPPPRPVWTDPVSLPATATVYECTPGPIAPSATRSLTFQVVKNTAASFDDDLTFRVDVIGEIHLADGTPLWFPAPQPRTDGVANTVNDYTVDAVWARVIGYNLFKTQVGLCSENVVPPPGNPDDEVQIGEECRFNVESGGWFGFETPGFTYIAVQNVQVVDELPDGQGYIDSTDPTLTSTTAIQGISLNPPPAPLDEGFFDWTSNTVVPAERITERDHWFRADVTTRLLNDPVDTSAPPNEHAAQSSNVMTSTFDAVFFNQSTMAEELYSLGPNTVGYPREVWRRVDLTVTEPELTVTKEVCNETRYGLGAACSNFVPLADDGDAFDTYVYRITIENEASDGGVGRAPAYDVTLTSVTDPSDQLLPAALASDGLDNDGDGFADGADPDGEGTISDTVPENAVPAEVIASYTHSAALLRIDPGDQVVLYYRVDPDDDVAPLQSLVATATADYDSLEGANGAQSAPTGANGEAGGARQYTSAPGQATIRIIPVEVSPKQVLRVSNSGLSVPANPQSVVIGEEVEFQLEALIPVAQLRDFVIRDELPVGLSCVDAPTVDLSQPPYDAAGFVPGGIFVPTCTDSLVEWQFGDQTVTMSDRTDRRFEFQVDFIARVDNVATSRDGVTLRNGGTSTITEVRYVDESANPVVLSIGEAALLVQEPQLDLATSFSVAAVDAADRPRVLVTATNNGTATAYNPRLFDDLRAVELAYRGDIQGANPPTDDVVTIDPDAPIFSWPGGLSLAPGDSVSFSYAVEVADTVEPERILAHTIEADWTSLPGQTTALNPSGSIGPDGDATGMRIGAIPNAGDTLNDYESNVVGSVPVSPVGVDKSDASIADPPEIGRHRVFEIEIQLPEGVTRDLRVEDALDTGSVGWILAHTATRDITYTFVGIDQINGAAPDESAFVAIPADGTTGTATWTIGDVTTLSEDDVAASTLDPVIRIRYQARIPNDLATNVGSMLQNTATVYSRQGETGLETSVADAPAAVTVVESALTATKTLTNVTPGKLATDPPAFNDILQYVVTIVNGGNASAYDVNVVDTLPPELTLSAIFTPTATIGGVPVAGFVATPAGAPAGPLVWGRQNGDDSLDVPAGQSLVLTYQVDVSSPPADGSTITNTVYTDWTSLQIDPGSLFERTGAGCPTTTAPNDYCFGPAVSTGTVDPAPAASPLVKETTQPSAAVGEGFRYRITVPSAPYAFPIYDVRIYDDLAASAADLRLLSVSRVSGSQTWTPVNTGTPTDLVLEDTTNGLDVPAGEQIVLDIEVVLEDTPTNVSGLSFTNSATYVYNYVDGNLSTQRTGAAGTSAAMTVVGPDTFVFDKRGPASLTLGAPTGYVLDAQNTGTGPAWNLTLVDQLPDLPAAGTCDTAPANFTARVFESNGSTPVSAPLVLGTDFTATVRGAPDCDVTLAMLTPATTVGPTERLIVGYDVVLDDDSQNGETVLNVAGAVQWWSADGSVPATAGDRRVFDRTLSNGTVGTDDHEDAHTASVALPVYRFDHFVRNVTTGEDPATVAAPGDVLRYRLRLENLRNAPLENVDVTSVLDDLNAPPAFEAGTLTLVSVPAGADASNTNANGGPSGTGLVDVRGLDLPGLNDFVEIEYEVTLQGVLSNGRTVANQADAATGGVPFAVSDDPLRNGVADPFVAGDEDPATVTITSAPDFRIEKTSVYATGDPTVLLAGETLRYTITVKNVGSDHATDATLVDATPIYTTYAPGSTTLNGLPVADAPGGVSPLVGGLALSAPEDPTPGALRADASATPDNVATIRFDVVVDPAAIDGTVVSNQGFVSAAAGGVANQPSDDPTTATPDDPTRDVVGNAPLLFAPKSVVLAVDGANAGVVDPGDTLRYTIRVENSGAADASNVLLSDAVPNDTTYVPDSLQLNGLAVGPPGATVSPLVAGIPISSSDLTPPLPNAGEGRVTPGQAATIVFDVVVDAGTPGGTVISNQALVRSDELPNLLSDGDGNPATGPEPTRIVVGNGQQVSITKVVAVVGGGPALPGSTLEYLVRVTNIGGTPATDVRVTDDLDPLANGWLTYVGGSATLDGSTVGTSFAGSTLTADYATAYGTLAPNATTELRFRATLDNLLTPGTNVPNTALVSWNAATQTASATANIAIGGTPGVGALNGSIWQDLDFDRAQGAGETTFADWRVELVRNGTPIQSVTTDASGDYRFTGVPPNDLNGDVYALRFSAPDAGARTASLGRAESAFTDGQQSITAIVVPAGSNLQDLDLPINPNGVVYESLVRTPLSGVTITMVDAATQAPVAASCFDDPVQQGQVTGASGFYRFDLNFSDGSCPSGGAYQLALSPADGDLVAGPSQIIPPQGAPTTPFDVPACPGSASDALPSTGAICEAQADPVQPDDTVPALDPRTNHYLALRLDATAAPGSSQLFNNHLAVDPVPGSSVAITKTTPRTNVSRGDLVPYQITFRNELGVDLPDLSLRDRYPAGFRYVEDSARVDGVAIEPVANGRVLEWRDLGLLPNESKTVVLLLAVGAGVTDGEFVNHAETFSSVNGLLFSGTASATVRVTPDPTFDCTDVLGKVFDDRNRDGLQDPGEEGLADVRLMTVQGLAVRTDAHGRFHITCAVVPNETRGSNFMLKLDDRTLPAGYRMTTRQAQVQRATRGKALRFRFGATIDRVVGLDLSDPVFEPGTATMRGQWATRVDTLIEALADAPSILRLTYLADTESTALVEQRLDAMEAEIRDRWQATGGEPLRVERAVHWRRGAPVDPSPGAALPSVDAGPPGLRTGAGASRERILPTETEPVPWTIDPERVDTLLADRLEEREVLMTDVETVKRTGVVPPIRFDSGVAEVSDETLARLRRVLDEMRELPNVRLHLIGHSDDRVLSPALEGRFGDNEGLSRERAGEVAEILQQALSLPPESISFTWMGDREPLAPNTTEAGRATNRRVEIEVWHDRAVERRRAREVVIPEEIRRVKVCRTETVCKLRYREGHERRARIRNLVPPLGYEREVGRLPRRFLDPIREALENLRDKQNVRVRILAHTSNEALSEREARIYGTALALTKARARRVALEVAEALDLPIDHVESDGLGARRPVASNATATGRALNRRIEVEFWHDEPLLELSDDFQVCPDAEGAETVTRVHVPSGGAFPLLPVEDGEIAIPTDLDARLRAALEEVAEEREVRLRFTGYTANERLSRRTADVYGDDIGLATARARRASDALRARLDLAEDEVEYEGRGFVHSRDVVNGGFVQGDRSYVTVDVIYEAPALLDDGGAIEVTRINRELRPQEPLSLNVMRITVDGVPIDDPARHSADIQRCTDVALHEGDIAFRFDDLSARRRLSATARPLSLAPGSEDPFRFRLYTNYPDAQTQTEVRIFGTDRSVRDEPLAVVPFDEEGRASWLPGPELAQRSVGRPEPVRALRFVVRAYDAEGRFDETAPQSLWLGDGEGSDALSFLPEDAPDEALLAGYGEGEPLVTNIPLAGYGTISVDGDAIPEGHSVWVAGREVPKDEAGRFAGEVLLPSGAHTVEVAVLDEEGNGELFLRDLALDPNDWFVMGLADLTLSQDLGGGRPNELDGNNATDLDAFASGRLAFFANGRWGEDWKLTASADTREGPVEDLFTNFLDKSPDSLFRRLDPDYHFPTFGDDSTVEELAPTLGKFYVKVSKGDDHLLWGNFVTRYTDNELALVERGLYGANARYQTDATTSFGARRFAIDGFAADPGTVSSREEFRGTGGSLYFLERQDLLIGSERLRIEIRDKATGLVSEVVSLQPELDYDIDYLQGRVLLSEPLQAIARDRLLVRSDGLSGDEAVLVVQYEYTPGFDAVETLNFGGQTHAWLTDWLKVGGTVSRTVESGVDTSLYGADLTLRRSAGSWIKLQAARSRGLVSTSLQSADGGFTFVDPAAGAAATDDAFAYRADVVVRFSDWLANLRGELSLYGQRLEAGYSGAGLNTARETDQYGGVLRAPLGDALDVVAKADRTVQERGLESTLAEVNVGYTLTDDWRVELGARHDDREDAAPIVAATQELGGRTDAVVQIAFEPKARAQGYVFGQATVQSSGDREENHRGGVGGSVRVSERLALDGEVSHGTLGPAAQVGTSFQRSERTKHYLNYALDSERGFDGQHARRGSLTAGTESRLSDSASVYLENQYRHESVNGLSRALGLDYAPTDRWTIGVEWEDGTLRDRRTNAETERRGGGLTVGYAHDGLNLSSGFEYVFNETEQSSGATSERTTWLFRNNLNYQFVEDLRLIVKFNHAISDSSEGDFFDGGFTEAIGGLAYRPVEHDRLAALVKYTYFYNVPTSDQTGQNGNAAFFLQKSHVGAIDVSYDVLPWWTIGGKYAYRSSQVSVDREDPDFFQNDAHLAILRNDLRFLNRWEVSVEGRLLELPDLDERRAGALAALYRYFGDHLKVGLGYNFTDFSEDLTDLSYDHHGIFLNVVGTF